MNPRELAERLRQIEKSNEAEWGNTDLVDAVRQAADLLESMTPLYQVICHVARAECDRIERAREYVRSRPSPLTIERRYVTPWVAEEGAL